MRYHPVTIQILKDLVNQITAMVFRLLSAVDPKNWTMC